MLTLLLIAVLANPLTAMSGGKFSTAPQSTVAIVFKNTKRTRCTGVVIAPRVILTAAHCLVGYRQTEMFVLEGMTDTFQEIEDRNYHEISWWVTHPKYDPNGFGIGGLNGKNDIGIIVTETNLSAPPVKIISDYDTPPKGERVILEGYGGEDGSSRYMRTGSSKYNYKYKKEIRFSGGDTPTSGDSGGPVYISKDGNRRLLGIVAEAMHNGCGGGGVASYAPAYRDWIKAHSDGLYDDTEDETSSGCSVGGSSFNVMWFGFITLFMLYRRRRSR